MWGSYCPSKACQILSSYKLKQDLFGRILIFLNEFAVFFSGIDQGINVFALNPGWVWTSFQDTIRSTFSFWLFSIVYPLLHVLKFAFAKTAAVGAQTTIYCAVEPSLENSKDLYFE